jgi:hypothetical protein
MKKKIPKLGFLGMALFALSLTLNTCGGGTDSISPATAQNGTISLAITDAPGLEFDHVWITLKAVWFHTSNAAGPQEAGWLKYPLSSPLTIDLTTLSNGTLSSAIGNFTLPVGDYQQIRLFLASTGDPLEVSPNPPSGSSVTLKYNNEVDLHIFGLTYQAPLYIPDPIYGIALFGNFQVTSGGTLRLAVDFDASHDTVKAVNGLNPEFILMPKLAHFDLDNAGAIAGQIDAAGITYGRFNFIIKAEELSSDGTYHVVRRATTIKSDGTFVLYPLPAGSSGKTYDILLRGQNVDTVIIKGVPVTKGTTPQNPTQISANKIPMNYDNNEFTVNLSRPMSPTGSWLSFYQTLSTTGELPYEIRFRRVNPYTGKFEDPIELSTGPIYVGTYNNGGSVSLIAQTPAEGLGGYGVSFDAYQFTRTYADSLITGTAGTNVDIPPPKKLYVAEGLSANTLSGSLNVPTPNLGLDRGYIVASRHGLIIDTIDAGTTDPGTGIMANGGLYSFTLPGGSSSSPLPGAFYTLHALGWKSGAILATLSEAIPRVADLRAGNDDVDLDMLKVLP